MLEIIDKELFFVIISPFMLSDQVDRFNVINYLTDLVMNKTKNRIKNTR